MAYLLLCLASFYPPSVFTFSLPPFLPPSPQENNTISVWNNGSGIPVVIHKEHQIYVPELIFGNLLTGSNFDDGMKKTTGGRNGYGAKLANIFSTKFTIETADKSTGTSYKQTFRENMTVREEPLVGTLTGKKGEFTCVTFTPDLARFKMERLDDATVGLLSKRAYDVAGCASGFPGKPLQVYLNGERLGLPTFLDYLKLYEGLEPPVAFERVNPRWEVGVGLSDGQFQQVSFVNGICTVKGGQHVNFVADQVVNKLTALVKKKNKGQEVKGHQIKNHLVVYVNALIENPAFDSQTKETLTTRPSAFGSGCNVSDKFLKAVEKSGLVDNVVNWAKFKQDEQLKKKGGSKKSKVMGITKLDDANFAGTARSSDCTLILTEGDSAKTLAISGLSVVGRDYYGVFPLKGKPLNVREAAHAQIVKNEEIQNIVKIMGLRFGVEYTDAKSLRYGHLMIMTDQDHDGSHIKGLLINLLHHFWPSLLKLPGFLQEFITPIVKVSKGANRSEAFYTIPEYEQWKERTNQGQGWVVKYYKGLGTSTAAEAKEYFSDLDTHRIDFKWEDEGDGDMIDMAFAKKRVEDRKEWLRGFTKGTFVDYKVVSMSYDTFVNQELILFSMADNQRSIPHLMDGLKPAQRKVLFACFKRSLKKEIKVAQLAGYVSEHSAYHHGEASLNGTIVGMAQNFVGSNNIGFLFPSGQFGTRIMGGKDAASPRYVFTRLEEVTRALFHPEDDLLLPYQDEDGQVIEPEYYAPIIPTVLVNGSDGIGTGWSSTVPNYNPRDIMANIRRLLKGEEPVEMHPWYRGFTGTIEPKGGRDVGSYAVMGTVRRVDEVTVEVVELPVKKWTQDYKQFLESMTVGVSDEKGAFVKDFKERHTDTSVYFVISISETAAPELLVDDQALLKRLKLEGSISTSNMHLFNAQGQIVKYESPLAVLQEYFPLRLSLYEARREALLARLDREWRRMDNKVRFILSVVDGSLVVSNRKKAELLQELARQGYELFAPGATAAGEEGGEGEPGELGRGYDYLLSMKIWSLTMERVEDLREQLAEKASELEALRGMTAADLWEQDMDVLEQRLDEYEEDLEFEPAYELAASNGKGKAGRGGGRKAGKAAKKQKPKKFVAVDSDGEPLSDEEEEDDDSEMEEDEDSDYAPSPKRKGGKAKAASKATAAASKPPAAAPRVIVPIRAPPKPPAAPKPAAAVAKKPAAAAGAAAKAGGKKTKKAIRSDEEESEEEEDDEQSGSEGEDVQVLSLAERMRMRMAVSPTPRGGLGGGRDDEDEDEEDDVSSSPIAPREAPPPRRAAAKKVVYNVGDDDDDSAEEEGGKEDVSDSDSEDEFMIVSPPPKKAPAAAKGKGKSGGAGGGGGGAVKRATKKNEHAAGGAGGRTGKGKEALFSPMKDTSPAVLKKARKAPAAAASKLCKPVAASKKKGKKADSEDEEEEEAEDDMVFSSPVVPRTVAPRRAAATKKVVYDEDEDEDEELEEEEPDSEFEEEDDDSEFEG